MSFLFSHLEELIFRDDPKDALRLVLVGFGVELPGGSQRAVRDDQPPFPAIVFHSNVVEPVGVAFDDLNLIEIPGDVCLFDVHLDVKDRRKFSASIISEGNSNAS